MTFEEILEEHNIPTAPDSHRHARSGWIQIECPFCDERADKFHMGYNKAGKYVNCWQCGPHRLEPTFQLLFGVGWNEAMKLAKGINKERDAIPFKKKGKLKMPSGCIMNELEYPHEKYLKHRGFNPDVIKQLWGIGCTSSISSVPLSIIIPIYHHNEIVSWTSRYIGKNKQIPRYRAAHATEESFPAKQLLYGAQYARYAAIIVEGPTDVWKVGPGAVATLGLSYTQDQFLAMLRYPTRVICFDNTREAQKVAENLKKDLSVFNGDTYNMVLDSDDPGCATKEEIKTIRRVAGLN